MGLYRRVVRPLLFRLDPERDHALAMRACEVLGPLAPVRAGLRRCYGFSDHRLESEVCGIRFPNPVGLAAGFDKNGRGIEMLAALGFGHLEIGSVSAEAAEGNPKPRLFRLPEDEAIIVNYGLPNEGAERVAARLAGKRLPIPLGVNIVKTNRGAAASLGSAEEVIADYVTSARVLRGIGDYLCLNLSCPNTETGRDFFAEPARVTALLAALSDVGIGCPAFLKVSPAGGVRAIEGLLGAVEGCDIVSGFIFNLPPGKPDTLTALRESIDGKPGAVSGKPVEGLINEAIRELYRRMDRSRYAIIGAGGIFSAEDAYRKIGLGASLVQLMTSMIYEGLGIVKTINRGLLRLLERDGLRTIAEAVGATAGV